MRFIIPPPFLLIASAIPEHPKHENKHASKHENTEPTRYHVSIQRPFAVVGHQLGTKPVFGAVIKRMFHRHRVTFLTVSP